jgi:hypothetical protein
MSITEWKLFRLRPSNFPSLRIAGFCRFLQQHGGQSLPDLFAKAGSSVETAMPAWQSLLRVPAFGYWSDHYWWGDEGKHALDDLIGEQRAFEIIINVILPILKLWSSEKGRMKTGLLEEKIYGSATSKEKNSVLRFMQNQLLPGLRQNATVRFHQGLIHQHRQCRSYGCAACGIFEKVMEAADQEG